MVFNDLDKSSTNTFCTLINLIDDIKKHEDSVVLVGQHLGLSKEDISVVLHDWDEHDLMTLESEDQKIEFVKSCFDFVDSQKGRTPESELYSKVLERLEIRTASLN